MPLKKSVRSRSVSVSRSSSSSASASRSASVSASRSAGRRTKRVKSVKRNKRNLPAFKLLTSTFKYVTIVHADSPLAAARKAVNILHYHSGSTRHADKLKPHMVYIISRDANGQKIGKYRVWATKRSRVKKVIIGDKTIVHRYNVRAEAVQNPHYVDNVPMNSNKLMTQALRRMR